MARKSIKDGAYDDARSYIGTLVPAWEDMYSTLLTALIDETEMNPHREETVARLQLWNLLFANIIATVRRAGRRYPRLMQNQPPVLNFQPGRQQPIDVVRSTISREGVRAVVLSTVMMYAWLGKTITEVPSSMFLMDASRVARTGTEWAFVKEIVQMTKVVTRFQGV